MIALALTLALGAWEQLPPDGGSPGMNFIENDTPTTSMVVTFGVGSSDDLSLQGLTAQAQLTLLEANSALPLKRWKEQLYATGATFDTAQNRYESHFVLTAPADEFQALARMVLPALLSPRINPAQLEALRNSAPAGSSGGTGSERVIQMLEPLLLKEGRELRRSRPGWSEGARVKAHIAEFFVPANATVTVVGSFRKDELRQLIGRARGGVRREVTRPELAQDVRRRFESPISMHVFGYPLPAALGAREIAGARVMTRRIREALIDTLRSQGLAYSVDVAPVFSPWFNGGLITIPAYDSSGSDLEDFLMAALHSAVHSPLTEADVARLLSAVQAEDRRWLDNPAAFADAMVVGWASADWLSPEYREALASLKPDGVQQASRSLFVNERRRFYVKFVRPMPVLVAPTTTKRKGGR